LRSGVFPFNQIASQIASSDRPVAKSPERNPGGIEGGSETLNTVKEWARNSDIPKLVGQVKGQLVVLRIDVDNHTVAFILQYLPQEKHADFFKALEEEGIEVSPELKIGKTQRPTAPTTSPPTVSSPIGPAVNNQSPACGGIDFRSLPIVTQAMSNLSLKVNNLSLSSLRNTNLDTEWSGIERLVNAGIIPSTERIKEYVQASCFNGNLDKDIDKVISCISDILRMEEVRCTPTETELKDILIVLESANSPQDLRTVFLGKATI
jgi:hypothetical protein